MAIAYLVCFVLSAVAAVCVRRQRNEKAISGVTSSLCAHLCTPQTKKASGVKLMRLISRLQQTGQFTIFNDKMNLIDN